MTDLETFLLDNSEFVYKVSKKKFMFTPYEQEEKFSDEDVWDYLGEYKFLQGIELPDSDVLIEMQPVDSSYIEYHKLSDIEFCRNSDDNKYEEENEIQE